MQRAFLYNLYVHDGKFPFATLFEGRKHRDKFNFFSESDLAIGCGPQKFTYICHFKRIEINTNKFLLTLVFVALAAVVAKAPYTVKTRV